MTLRHCIIHEWCVKQLKASSDRNIRTEGRMALAVIADIRRKFGDEVIEIAHGHPSQAAEYIQPEDTVVVLSGAFRSSCLSGARDALKNKGVRVLFHQQGSVPFRETDGMEFYNEESPTETASDLPFDGWVSVSSPGADPHD